MVRNRTELPGGGQIEIAIPIPIGRQLPQKLIDIEKVHHALQTVQRQMQAGVPEHVIGGKPVLPEGCLLWRGGEAVRPDPFDVDGEARFEPVIGDQVSV